MTKVLFLLERFCDADPAAGPSGAEQQIVGALKSTGLIGESRQFYFDVFAKQFGRDRMEELLLETCEVFAPDLVVYTPLGGALGEALNPRHPAMQKIMARHKVYLNLWDGPEKGLETQWLPSCHLLGVDSILQCYRNHKQLGNIIFVHSVVDPRVHYHYRDTSRDIDVSFIGSIDPGDRRWPLRGEYTSYLKANGIKTLTAGGQRTAGRLTTDACGELLRRSKISLDFCRSTDGRATMHLRMFEVMSCGAMLMEHADTLAGELFEPGRDFTIFTSQADLLDKVRYYLTHTEERRQVAVAGHEKATRLYNARNMWGYVFERLGLPIGDLAHEDGYLKHKGILESL